jgi:FlgN protein
MNSTQVLNALERERRLLEDFICLSEEQLLLLADEDLEGFDNLLQRRSELMTELTAAEANLAFWISQVRTDPSVSPEIMNQMRSVNAEIVRMANHIVQIDEHAHGQLDMIKQKTSAELRSIERGRHALRHYAASYEPPKSDLDVRG